MLDGFSVYFDASHRKGSDALYPQVLRPGEIVFAPARAADDRIDTLLVAGARYTFASGDDLRLEYVHNDAGYNQENLDLATAAVGLARDPALVAAYAAPGLDLIGRDYLYASLRFPDLGASDAWNASVRYLVSLHDHSGTLFGSTEWIASDNLLVFLLGVASHGDDDQELTRLVRASGFLGAQYSW
jgi:hypothetical protein